MAELPTCPRPRHGEQTRLIHDQAYVCSTCGEDLISDLQLVAKLAGEATTTVARLDEIDPVGGPFQPDTEPWSSADDALYPHALPVDLAAARDHDGMVTGLLTWARHISDTRGRPMPVVYPYEHPLAVLAVWLTRHVEWLRHRKEADDAFDELLHTCAVLVRVVDRHPDRWYAGRCTCGEELNPVAGTKMIRCDACGTEYDADNRKAQLLRDLEEMWATADQCAHAMTALGLAVNASTIRTWASQRHLLAPHPESTPGRPRYRIGSVRLLVEQMRAEQKERTLRAAVRTAELAAKRAAKAKADT